MNTEAIQETSATHSPGARLRAAREQMNLTQQNVAERLCLKLSTVRNIEEDSLPEDLASTFLRGYIRSYARLVHVPEEELLPIMAKQAPIRAAKVAPMQSFSLGKRRKKRDGWLMFFTWIILFIVVSLTGAWWWQNHKAAQDDLVSMADQNLNNGQSQSITLDTGGHSDSAVATHSTADAPSTARNTSPPAASASPSAPATAATTPVQPEASGSSPAVKNTPDSADPSAAAPAPVAGSQQTVAGSQQTVATPTQSGVVSPAQSSAGGQVAGGQESINSSAGSAVPAVDPNALAMNFTQDCWLEVNDATGKKLFSGMQRGGGKLTLSGATPYRLKIGAPGAVQIQYQGQPVDLSRFIRTNQVARLTVGHS